jgi:hypothetical protein
MVGRVDLVGNVLFLFLCLDNGGRSGPRGKCPVYIYLSLSMLWWEWAWLKITYLYLSISVSAVVGGEGLVGMSYLYLSLSV